MKQYKYIRIAEIISISKKTSHLESIKYYQDRLNQEASQGWNFIGTESLSSQYTPGCFNELLLKIPIVNFFIRDTESVKIKMLVFERGEEGIRESIPLAKTISSAKVETLLPLESQAQTTLEKSDTKDTPMKQESLSEEQPLIPKKEEINLEQKLQDSKTSLSNLNPKTIKFIGIGLIALIGLLLVFNLYTTRGEQKSGNENNRKTSFSFFNSSPNAVTGTVNDPAGIRFRSGAGIQYQQIGFMTFNTKMEVIDTKSGPIETHHDIVGRWYKVRFEDKEGWAFGGLIRLDTENESVFSERYAKEKMNTASEQDKKLAGLMEAQGVRLHGKKDEKALTNFENAVKLYPTASVYYNYGNSLANAKLFQEAKNAYLLSIELGYPQVYYSYYNIACMESLMQNRTESLEYIEKAINNGYNAFDHILKDPDLQWLRDNEPGFNEWLDARRK